MDIRRLLIIKDTISFEGGPPAAVPVTRVAACAVIANPLAGVVTDDVSVLVPFGAELGASYSMCLKVLEKAVISYGKAAIVGTAGDIEHAAAIIHPRMGKTRAGCDWRRQSDHPVERQIGAAGVSIDIPLGSKDDVWSFDQIDTMSVFVPGAPRPKKSW
jgi:hypothetical protein